MAAKLTHRQQAALAVTALVLFAAPWGAAQNGQPKQAVKKNLIMVVKAPTKIAPNEINAHPQRLDLDWRFHQRALELGCMLSINPDAHDISELDLVRYGVTIARKGGVPRDFRPSETSRTAL